MNKTNSVLKSAIPSLVVLAAGLVAALAVLLVIAVVLIIADHQTIGAFMLPFAIGLIIDLALVGICLRVLLGSAITVFGTSTSLYISAKKEAA